MTSPATPPLDPGPDTVLANARLILPDRVMPGALILRHGLIAAIEDGTAVPPGAIDCGGEYLAPGLVELHTDNLEQHIQPRPGVAWPHAAAIVAHDAELAGVGITTVFDGDDLLVPGEAKARKHRWTGLSLVFQGAMNAFNPVVRVEDQIAEPMVAHFSWVALLVSSLMNSQARSAFLDPG